MSFASILSGPAEEAPPKRQSPPLEAAAPAPMTSESALKARSPVPIAASISQPKIKEQDPDSAPSLSSIKADMRPSSTERRLRTGELEPTVSTPINANGLPTRAAPARKLLSERDNEAVNKLMAEIDNADKSDVEGPGFEGEMERYQARGRKRVIDAEKAESVRRKVFILHPAYPQDIRC